MINIVSKIYIYDYNYRYKPCIYKNNYNITLKFIKIYDSEIADLVGFLNKQIQQVYNHVTLHNYTIY